MRQPLAGRLLCAAAVVGVGAAAIVAGPPASAQTDPAAAPPPVALAATDTTLPVIPDATAWHPASTDTVWTALLQSMPHLAKARADVRRRTDAGEVVFARIRASYDRYWYELVAGPWPDAAARDRALGDAAPLPGVGSASPPTLWAAASRGLVAGREPAAPAASPGAGGAAADSSAGDR